MKKFLITFILCLCPVICINGQVFPQQERAKQILREQQRVQRGFNRLTIASEKYRRPTSSVTISRYSSELEEKARKYIQPDKAFIREYADFLKLPNTGIVKILSEKICSYKEKERFENTIKRCPHSFITDGGQYFSFRRKDFTKASWSDIGIKDDWIFSLGMFNQGILVNLGDIPPENLSLTEKGVTYLNDFQPATDVEQADKQFAQFEKGVVAEGLNYRQIQPIETDKTYALRVVAYDADFFWEIKQEDEAFKIYPLQGDIREDVIIAFRIIDKDLEGNLTLLWKELQRQKAPVMSIPKQAADSEDQNTGSARKN